MDLSFFSNMNQKLNKSKKKESVSKKKTKTKSSSLDQWYTSPRLAQDIIEKFYSLSESNKCDIIIEPSAGTGILLDLIKGEKIGFDLDPKRSNINQEDFLKVTRKDILQKTTKKTVEKANNKDKNLCFLGNPPFSIAKDFFNHAASMDPLIIAMILPRRFKNPKFIRNLNDNYHLIYSYDIDCCYIYNKKEVELPTVFQVWSKYKDGRMVKRLDWNNQKTEEKDFVFIRSKKTKEKIFSLRNTDKFVFVIKNSYNLPNKISTTNINDLWDIYIKRLRSIRTKKSVNKIIETIIDSYHFLEVLGDTNIEKKRNAKIISDLLNSIDPTVLLKYQTCSKSMKRCSLSQENLLELYYALKDNSSKSIFLTNSLLENRSRSSSVQRSIFPASMSGYSLKDLNTKHSLNKHESKLHTI